MNSKKPTLPLRSPSPYSDAYAILNWFGDQSCHHSRNSTAWKEWLPVHSTHSQIVSAKLHEAASRKTNTKQVSIQLAGTSPNLTVEAVIRDLLQFCLTEAWSITISIKSIVRYRLFKIQEWQTSTARESLGQGSFSRSVHVWMHHCRETYSLSPPWKQKTNNFHQGQNIHASYSNKHPSQTTMVANCKWTFRKHAPYSTSPRLPPKRCFLWNNKPNNIGKNVVKPYMQTSCCTTAHLTSSCSLCPKIGFSSFNKELLWNTNANHSRLNLDVQVCKKKFPSALTVVQHLHTHQVLLLCTLRGGTGLF